MHLPSGDIRRKFSAAMSKMYCTEVPDYQKVIDLVLNVNKGAIDQGSVGLDIDNITEERHGAIRLGKASELSMMRRLFVAMGMHPVGYYDLSVAGIPVHSTAFRPVTLEEIDYCPFRIFTSLLRLDLISDLKLRSAAQDVLDKRSIFSPMLIQQLEKFEKNKGLTKEEAAIFIDELVRTFRWNNEANVSKELYQKLNSSHRLIADVVSFKGPHINHLTPRTLDIDKVQDQMSDVGLNAKAIVEGAPKRKVPILLRQTAFKALEEKVSFVNSLGIWSQGAHTARFGEIEQRGAALTAKGQALYDMLLSKVRVIVTPNPDGSNKNAYKETLEKVFENFPDDLETLKEQKLAYFQYKKSPEGKAANIELSKDNIEENIQKGYVTISPITYEDFLPVSAAGIFQSNLGDAQGQEFTHQSNQKLFETALGGKVLNFYSLYEKMQEASFARICA